MEFVVTSKDTTASKNSFYAKAYQIENVEPQTQHKLVKSWVDENQILDYLTLIKSVIIRADNAGRKGHPICPWRYKWKMNLKYYTKYYRRGILMTIFVLILAIIVHNWEYLNDATHLQERLEQMLARVKSNG